MAVCIKFYSSEPRRVGKIYIPHHQKIATIKTKSFIDIGQRLLADGFTYRQIDRQTDRQTNRCSTDNNGVLAVIDSDSKTLPSTAVPFVDSRACNVYWDFFGTILSGALVARMKPAWVAMGESSVRPST